MYMHPRLVGYLANHLLYNTARRPSFWIDNLSDLVVLSTQIFQSLVTMMDQTDLHELQAIMNQVVERLFENFGDVTNKATENDARLKRLEEAVTQLEKKVASLERTQSTRESSTGPKDHAPQESTQPRPEIQAVSQDLVSTLETQRPGTLPSLNKPVDGLKLPTEPPRTPLRPPPFLPATTPRKHAAEDDHTRETKKQKRPSIDSSSLCLKPLDYGISKGSRSTAISTETETQSTSSSDLFPNPPSSPIPAKTSLSQPSPGQRRRTSGPRSYPPLRPGSLLGFSTSASAEEQGDADEAFKDGDLPMADVSARPPIEEDSDNDPEKTDEEINNRSN
ncbi:hypothetical protein RRF57_010330 [Xylaria bambusicola]|uniref:Uncharacterized protein n=1 Tax=Xylaria bambusicola TaxID=326684 RepID=A0AAN7US92_9PEZI